jgi:inner membrane protein
MLFHTHLMIGVVAFLLLKDYFTGGNEIVFLTLVLLGSIFPDIDDGKSKMKKASGIIGSIISYLFKHRGIFHSVIFALGIFVLVIIFWNSYYAFAVLIGYCSHLLGDFITPMGIRLFYPFSNFKIRGPIRVGGIGEWVILFGMGLLVLKELLF